MFDSKNMCHYHGCQRQRQEGDSVCATCRMQMTKLDAFLARERAAFKTAKDVEPLATTPIEKTKSCYLCANCRRLFVSPQRCCDALNLLHIETDSIVRNISGAIVECRPILYPIVKGSNVTHTAKASHG